MRKRTLIAAPALPTAAPAISHSTLKPKRNTKKVQDLDERRLLKQVIVEAKAFSRPDSQEHGEK
jgi:hypothetical protein